MARIFVLPTASRPLGLLYRANRAQVDFDSPTGAALCGGGGGDGVFCFGGGFAGMLLLMVLCSSAWAQVDFDSPTGAMQEGAMFAASCVCSAGSPHGVV
jgi:hypothetical protein